jgi:uncharacterized protein (UPF0335 family)
MARTAYNGVNLSVLKDKINTIEKLTQDVKALQKDMREITASAQEMGVNIWALKIATKLQNMNPAKRNDFLLWLQVLCDVLGVWDQATLFDEPKVPQAPASGELVELFRGS